MIDALVQFFVVLGIWLLIAAGLATLATLTGVATAAWIWRRVRRRPTRPSWAHGRTGAREFARTHTSAPSGRTEPHRQEPS